MEISTKVATEVVLISTKLVSALAVEVRLLNEKLKDKDKEINYWKNKSRTGDASYKKLFNQYISSHKLLCNHIDVLNKCITDLGIDPKSLINTEVIIYDY